jgi:vacuolar iron transporter family protein
MGLGGYLAASSDTEHYLTERAREEREVRDIPSAEAAELTTVLTSYGAERRGERTDRHGIA